MIYTFTILFLAIIVIKLAWVYQNYLQVKKNYEIFCKKWNIIAFSKLKIFNPEIPEIQKDNWRLTWQKQGRGRSFNHILKIYFELPQSLIEFQLVHKNLLSKIHNSENWNEIEKNLFSNNKDLKNQTQFLQNVSRIQTEYGWGILEVKNQQAFYSIIAEPSESQAWKHLEDVILLLINQKNFSKL